MKGIHTALMTMFDTNGQIDKEATRKLVRYNLDHCKVDGMLACGTIGEMFNMPMGMCKTVLETVADENNKCGKLFANVGANIFEDAVELADFAYEMGYSGVSLVPPFYYKYTTQEIIDYYRRFADRSKLPVFIYNIPGFSPYAFTLNDYETLFKHEQIIGTKFSHNDYSLLERLRLRCPEAVLFTGFDDYLFFALTLGTDGAIGGSYNIVGHWAKELFDEMQKGNYNQALAIQHNICTVLEKLGSVGLFAGIKAVLALEGVGIGNCKAPMSPTNDAQRAMAKEVLEFIQTVDAAKK